MSEENVEQQNVERVLDTYARFNAGERRPEFLSWHPEGEYHAATEDPDSDIHRGFAALTRHFASWVEAYPDLKVEPLETRATGDQVFAWVHFSGHGAASGMPMEMELAHVATVRDDKVVRTVEYSDRAEALEAAGLRD
jgi:ketosteroid isomerase-like protein